MLLGNPGIFGQGYGCELLYSIPGCTWDSRGLLGIPGILGQGHGCELLYAIPGYTWDSPVFLGNPGILGQCCMPSQDVHEIVLGYWGVWGYFG